MIKIYLFLSIFVFCAFSLPSANAQECPVEYGFRYTYNFARDYKSSVTIYKSREISQSILSKIQEQLKVRVGEKFFKKLKFDYGYARDFDDTQTLQANEAERIDGYDIVYRFSDRSKGLKTFYFKVVADAKGNLIDDLALPDIASNPQKANLVPCKQALTIAAQNGFPLERSSIYFMYDWEVKSFIWDIHDRQAVEPDKPILFGNKGTYRKISIEANTGKVLKIYKETIIL